MVKAVQVSVAVCNVQGVQSFMAWAIGEDGYVYQFVAGTWQRLPALDSVITQAQAKIEVQ
jgi:hypothetical protein